MTLSKELPPTIGGLIGALIGIPSILYLLSPSLQAEEDTDTHCLGLIENYPIGVPTRFEFTVLKSTAGSERRRTMVYMLSEKTTMKYASFLIFVPIWVAVFHGIRIGKTTSVLVMMGTLTSSEMWLAVPRHAH